MRMRPITTKKIVRILLILLLVLFTPSALVVACYMTFYYDTCFSIGIESGMDPNHDIKEVLWKMSPHYSPQYYSPQWTLDGKHIVFTEDVHGRPMGRVYVVTSDGANLLSIERDEAPHLSHSPTISPDGSRIAYSSYRGQKNDRVYYGIDTVALDGTGRRRLTEETGWDFSPVWSPSGDRMAFARHDDLDSCGDPRRRGLYAMDADGSNIHKVVDIQSQDGEGIQEESNVRFQYHSGPVWSHDSRLLAYVVAERREYRDHTTLYTVNADGSDLRRLLTFSLIPQNFQWLSTPDGELLDPSVEPARSIASAPDWSPDGRSIAFLGVDEADSKLYTIGSDGSDLREVAELPSHAGVLGTALWSRDGSRIMFSQGRTLYSVNADGSDLHIVQRGDYFSPAPDESRIAHLVRTIRAPESNVALYTTAPDGSDARLLVRRRDDGELEAVGPGYRPSTAGSSCSAGVVVPDPESNPELVGDCEALSRMFDRLVVAEELNWDPDTPITEWEGVTLEVPTLVEDTLDAEVRLYPPRVRGLSLPDRGLVGSFPLSVTELTGLLVLDISGNDLGGAIPPQLARLGNLRKLYLDGHFGAIPPELGQMINLQVLRLVGPAGGPIPSELGDLANLRELTLFGILAGPIPPELGNMEALETLKLSSRLSGPIPMELGRLANLREMNLGNNELSGPIPPELGNMETLEKLDLSRNELSGPIPRELGNMTALKTLDLSFNELSGPIPPELGNMAALETSNLTNNELSGPIPAELGGLTNLRTLELYANSLSGPIPSELGNLPNLEYLHVDDTSFTGCIPTGLRGRFGSYTEPEHCKQ